MFACLADEISDTGENTDQLPSPQSPDIKSIEVNIKMTSKRNIINLVKEDNVYVLEQVLLAERAALEQRPPSRKGKKNKQKGLEENDEFSKLSSRVLHYACALDSEKCCRLLLDSEKFPCACVDAIDEADQRSGLHIASFYHSHKCVDILLKKGANASLLNKYSMTPLEDALLSLNCNVDWDFSTSAADVVKRIGDRDLKFLKTLGIKCNCKDNLAYLAFKLARGLHLVPLVGLLHVRRSIVNVVIKRSEVDIEPGGTIVDYLLGRVLVCSPHKSFDEVSKKPSNCKLINSEKAGMPEFVNSKKMLGAWDDANPEINHRKDLIEGEQVSSKYSSVFNEADAHKKADGLATEHCNMSSECRERTNDDSQTNCKIARKMLECVLQFVQSWSPHSQGSLPPLIQAVQGNDEALVNALLECGAPVNDTDNDCNTALHWVLNQATSVRGSSINCTLVEMLLDAGATVTAKNNVGETPVHIAAGQGHLEALSSIIKRHGGSINVLAGTRETPLHYAVKNNHLKCAALLLRCGASRDMISLRSQKLFQLACSSEMKTLLSLDEEELLEACNNANTSQLYPFLSGSECFLPQESQGIDCRSSPASSASSAESFSFSPSVVPAIVSVNKATSIPQCQKQASSQLQTLIAVSPEKSDLVTNQASWQTVHKKSRKHTNSLGSSPNMKEKSNAKTAVSLPPYKSVLCRFYASNKKCEWGNKCHFAHSENELINLRGNRKTERVQGRLLGSQTSDQGPKNHKIKLCVHHEKNGTCMAGLKCGFAHGQSELRQSSASNVTSSARFGPYPSTTSSTHGQGELRQTSTSSSVVLGARLRSRPSTASSVGSNSREKEEEGKNSQKYFVVGWLPHANGRQRRGFIEGDFGKVTDSAAISANNEDGIIQSSDFGFLTFEQQRDVDEAVKRHYLPWQSKTMELKKATNRIELAPEDEGVNPMPYFGISSPTTVQSSALASPSSGVCLYNDGLHSPGMSEAGYHCCMPLPSLSVELSPRFSQGNLQYVRPSAHKSGANLPKQSTLIQKKEQMEDCQNNETAVHSVRANKCILEKFQEKCACCGSKSLYKCSQNAEQVLKADDTLSSSPSHSHGWYSLPSFSTMPSPSVSCVCAMPFPNDNKSIGSSGSCSFTSYSSCNSDSFHRTVPEANGPDQIDDEEFSELLALLEVGHTPEAVQSKPFSCRTPTSDSGFNQTLQPVSVQNGWRGDFLASCQDIDSQFIYNGGLYSSALQNADYKSQRSRAAIQSSQRCSKWFLLQ